MSVQVGKSDTDQCIVRIGVLTRSDPDAEIHIVVSTGPGDKDWKRVERKFVEGKKLMKFDLPPGEYHVMVVGDKVAGVINTAGHTLEHPWNVFLEAPQEHNKDYIRKTLTAPPDTVRDVVKRILH